MGYRIPIRKFLKDDRGVALILTILVISLIVALTLQFNTFTRCDLQAAANMRDGIRLRCVARSGFNYALGVLAKDKLESSIDTLHEDWADPETLSGNSAAMFSEGRFEAKVSDHSGRIQINKLIKSDGTYNNVQRDLLIKFLQLPEFGLEEGTAVNIVNAIKDWIDSDNDVTEGPGYGAENSYYQGLENPYACRNRPLDYIEDLIPVRGMTNNLFHGNGEKPGISRYLSPHGDGKININTAEPLVLKALSEYILDQDRVEDWLEYRENKKNDLSDYKKYPGLSDMTQEQKNRANSLLTTRSTYFEIRSDGFKGSMIKRVTGITERTGTGLQILSWKVE